MLPVSQLGAGRVPGDHESLVIGIGHDPGQLRTQTPQHLWTVPWRRGGGPGDGPMGIGLERLNVVVRVDRDPSRGVSPVIGEQIGKNRFFPTFGDS